MNPYKPIALCLFFMLAVTACANAAPTPLSSSTATQAAILAIAQTPLPAPTAVPTPTEAGPKVGNTKVENGFTYSLKHIETPDGKEYVGYFRQVAVDLPFWDWTGGYVPILNPDGKSVAKNADGSLQYQQAKNVGPINVLVELGVPDEFAIKSIMHNPRPADLQRQGDYIGAIGGEMTKHYLPGNGLSQDSTNILYAALQSGAVTHTFKDGDKSYTFPVSPESGATVYVINYDNATTDKGFSRWNDGFSGYNFATAFWGVDQKGVIGAIASETPLSTLTDNQLLMLPLWHMTVAMNNKDVTHVTFNDSFFQELMQFAIKPPWVQFTIVR